jgi:hypothetical protein
MYRKLRIYWDYYKGIGASFSVEGLKLMKRTTFQSFEKSLKNVVNPTNQTICRVFYFIPIFNIFKNAQKICATIGAQFENLQMRYKILVEVPKKKRLSTFTSCLNDVVILHLLI